MQDVPDPDDAGVEILADGEPSALPDRRTCEHAQPEVEILADGEPSALHFGGHHKDAGDRVEILADGEPSALRDRRPVGDTALGHVEILADGEPSALHDYTVLTGETILLLRSSPTANRRRCVDGSATVTKASG